MSFVLWVILFVALSLLFIMFFKRTAIFVIIVGGLAFVGYKLGFVTWIFGRVFGV